MATWPSTAPAVAVQPVVGRRLVPASRPRGRGNRSPVQHVSKDMDEGKVSRAVTVREACFSVIGCLKDTQKV
jgi:hypothetical protein